MNGHQRGRMPAAWEAALSDEYEWVPLRLPPDVSLYTDGSRRVLLRRRKSATNWAHPDDQPTP